MWLRSNEVAEDRIAVITNWSAWNQVVPVAKEDNPLIEDWGLTGKVLVVHCGKMGRVHELSTLLDAATRA